MYKPPFSAGITIMPTNLDIINRNRESFINNSSVAENTVAGDVSAVAVSFLTDRSQIEALLPSGKNLSLNGPPVVSVVAVYQGSLNWLAGRGYNLILVMLPVIHKGKKGETVGFYLPVVWENMTERDMDGGVNFSAGPRSTPSSLPPVG